MPRGPAGRVGRGGVRGVGATGRAVQLAGRVPRRCCCNARPNYADDAGQGARGSGCWALGVECWVLGVGCWALGCMIEAWELSGRV